MTYHCRSCRAPLQLDESLTHIPKAQARVLLSKKPPEPAPFEPRIPPERLKYYTEALELGSSAEILRSCSPEPETDGQLFVLVLDTEEDGEQLPDFSKIKSLRHVFEFLLHNQDIAHPMCAECLALLAENYKFKFDETQREKEHYSAFLRKLRLRGDDAVEAKLAQTAQETAALAAAERGKMAELELLEREHEELVAELLALDTRLAALKDGELRRLLQSRNALLLELQAQNSHLEQGQALHQRRLNHLDELRAFNVHTHLFHITFGLHGAINGFRLGHKVPWAENNAALGQVVHLLAFLQAQRGVALDKYELVPMGSRSSVRCEGRVLALHLSNEFSLGKLFNYNKLDVLMIALADIVARVGAGTGFPYEIRHDRVGGCSVRVLGTQWTEACRFLLTNLNWMLLGSRVASQS